MTKVAIIAFYRLIAWLVTKNRVAFKVTIQIALCVLSSVRQESSYDEPLELSLLLLTNMREL